MASTAGPGADYDPGHAGLALPPLRLSAAGVVPLLGLSAIHHVVRDLPALPAGRRERPGTVRPRSETARARRDRDASLLDGDAGDRARRAAPGGRWPRAASRTRPPSWSRIRAPAQNVRSSRARGIDDGRRRIEPCRDDDGCCRCACRVDLARDGHRWTGPGHMVALGRSGTLAGPLGPRERSALTSGRMEYGEAAPHGCRQGQMVWVAGSCAVRLIEVPTGCF